MPHARSDATSTALSRRAELSPDCVRKARDAGAQGCVWCTLLLLAMVHSVRMLGAVKVAVSGTAGAFGGRYGRARARRVFPLSRIRRPAGRGRSAEAGRSIPRRARGAAGHRGSRGMMSARAPGRCGQARGMSGMSGPLVGACSKMWPEAQPRLASDVAEAGRVRAEGGAHRRSDGFDHVECLAVEAGVR